METERIILGIDPGTQLLGFCERICIVVPLFYPNFQKSGNLLYIKYVFD